MEKIEICKLDDIEKGGSQVFQTSLGQIAVFRTRKNLLFATAARCPHMGGPLAHALYNGDRHLTCPIHGYAFNVESGLCSDETLGRTLQTFQVELNGQNISVAKIEEAASVVQA